MYVCMYVFAYHVMFVIHVWYVWTHIHIFICILNQLWTVWHICKHIDLFPNLHVHFALWKKSHETPAPEESTGWESSKLLTTTYFPNDKCITLFLYVFLFKSSSFCMYHKFIDSELKVSSNFTQGWREVGLCIIFSSWLTAIFLCLGPLNNISALWESE